MRAPLAVKAVGLAHKSDRGGVRLNVTHDGLGTAMAAVGTDQVLVEVTAPTCSLSVVFKELKEDAIKYEVTNTSGIVATLQSLTFDFPSDTRT